MTIDLGLVQSLAPHVGAKAEQKRGIKNPIISLQKLEFQCFGNEMLEELLEQMVVCSLRYTEAVLLYEIIAIDPESTKDGTRIDQQKIRSSVHDATIDAVKILSRNLKKASIDNSWIAKLEAGGRPAYMLFAIQIAFEAALRVRVR